MQLYFDEVRFNERTSSRGLAASATKRWGLLKYWISLSTSIASWTKRQSFPRRIPLLERQWWNSPCRGQKAPNRGLLQTSSLCSKQERNPTQGLPPKLQVHCICLFVSILRTMRGTDRVYGATGSWQWKIRWCIDSDCRMFVDNLAVYLLIILDLC